MAIQDLLQRLGQRVGTGFERMGATTDPRLSPEAQRLAGIQNLSQALRRTGATLSGDPQRMALQAQEDERLRQRRLRESFLRDYPEYGEILRATESGVPASMFTPTKPTKGPTSYEEYIRTDDTPTNEEYQQFLLRTAQAGATKIDFSEKGLGEAVPKNYEAAKAKAYEAVNLDSNLDNLENMLDQGLNTGFGAEAGLTLNRVGQLLLGDEYKTTEVAGAESFLAGTGNIVIPLVKNLGVNPTDNDLKFITKAAPGLTKSVEGNRLMIKALKLSNARRIDEHNFDMDYYNNPETENTIFQRDRAFAEHMRKNPQLYTAQSLIQEYNNLLEREAEGKLNSEEFTSTNNIPLPPGF